MDLGCIVMASIMLKKITLGYSNTTDSSDSRSHFSVCSSSLESLASSVNGAAGWTLFFSLVVLLYQVFSLLQMFFYLRALYMKIQLGKYQWYLFPLIVSDLHLLQ